MTETVAADRFGRLAKEANDLTDALAALSKEIAEEIPKVGTGFTNSLYGTLHMKAELRFAQEMVDSAWRSARLAETALSAEESRLRPAGDESAHEA